MPAPPDHADVDALVEVVPVFLGLAVAAQTASQVPVTLTQYRLLHGLAHHGPMGVGAAARWLRVHTSSVTRAADRLVRDGHLTRGVNDQDRREVTLQVTARGRAVVDEVIGARRDEVRRLLDAVPGPDRRELARLAGVLVAADAASRSHDTAAWGG